MNATFNPEFKTKFTTSFRKEGKTYFESFNVLIPYTDKEGNNRIRPIVELRLYGTDTTWYGCLWVNNADKNIHTSGTGKASGYGYHKPSAAAQEAINNAGFKLSQSISGVGEQAIEAALLAIAKSVGIENGAIFHAHH